MSKKILGVLGFIVVLIAVGIGGKVGKEVGKSAFSSSKPTKQEVEDIIIEDFAKFASQYNKKLPMMIDKNTQLDKVTVGSGARVVYHHSFPNYTSSDIDSNWISTNLKSQVKNKVCATKGMKKTLQYGGTFVYAYSGNDGVEIERFEIDRDDCGYQKLSP